MIAPLFAALLSTLLLFGCDDTPTEVGDYDPEPVLIGFVVNGQPVKEVFLERVAALEGYYDPRDNGIDGSDMRIFEVGGSDTLALIDDPNFTGRYVPAAGTSLTPQGMKTYRIEVDTPQGEHLWAEALVPGAMSANGSVNIVQVYEDSIHVLNNDPTVVDSTAWDTTRVEVLNREMPHIRYSWSDVDSAQGFQGFSLALTDRDALVPLDPGWDPEDEDDALEDIDRDRFGYALVRSDQRVIDLFWLAFNWEGPYRVELRALSQGYYDYLFSKFRVDQGLINRPSTNVHGGIGIFGALSKHTHYIILEKVQR